MWLPLALPGGRLSGTRLLPIVKRDAVALFHSGTRSCCTGFCKDRRGGIREGSSRRHATCLWQQKARTVDEYRLFDLSCETGRQREPAHLFEYFRRAHLLQMIRRHASTSTCSRERVSINKQLRKCQTPRLAELIGITACHSESHAFGGNPRLVYDRSQMDKVYNESPLSAGASSRVSHL